MLSRKKWCLGGLIKATDVTTAGTINPTIEHAHWIIRSTSFTIASSGTENEEVIPTARRA